MLLTGVPSKNSSTVYRTKPSRGRASPLFVGPARSSRKATSRLQHRAVFSFVVGNERGSRTQSSGTGRTFRRSHCAFEENNKLNKSSVATSIGHAVAADALPLDPAHRGIWVADRFCGRDPRVFFLCFFFLSLPKFESRNRRGATLYSDYFIIFFHDAVASHAMGLRNETLVVSARNRIRFTLCYS